MGWVKHAAPRLRDWLLVPALCMGALLGLAALSTLLSALFAGEAIPLWLEVAVLVPDLCAVYALFLVPLLLPLTAFSRRVPLWALVCAGAWWAASIGNLLSIFGSDLPGNPWDGPYGLLLRRSVDGTLSLLALAASVGVLIGLVAWLNAREREQSVAPLTWS